MMESKMKYQIWLTNFRYWYSHDANSFNEAVKLCQKIGFETEIYAISKGRLDRNKVAAWSPITGLHIKK
jgi:hypothetical protein